MRGFKVGEAMQYVNKTNKILGSFDETKVLDI